MRCSSSSCKDAATFYSKRQVRQVVLEVIWWREHLTSGDLVVDVVQHVEHLAVAHHYGVWA
jgi:hypothetical protein